MLQHQEFIIAIKDAIKPGLELCFKRPFDRDMVTSYLIQIRKRVYEEDEEALK